MNPYGAPWTGGIWDSPFQREIEQSPSTRNAVSGLAFYASAGILDPKAPVVDVPIVARATGLSYWMAYGSQLPFAMLASVVIGVTLDPAHKFDDWGVDEVWEWGPKHEYESWQPTGMPGSV